MKELGGEGRKSSEQTKFTMASDHQKTVEAPQPLKKEVPQRPRVIEITGPVKMEPGQNFYDQFPFQGIIAKASEHTDIDQSDLRHVLSKYVHMGANPNLSIDEKKKIDGIHLDIIGKLKPTYFKNPNYKTNKKENIQRVLKGICDTLDGTGLPDWKGYIAAKHTRDIYDNNGRYRPHQGSGKVVSEPTYMAWAEEKILRDRRIQTNSRIIAVSEAFPQQTQAVNEAVVESGAKPDSRTWRIIQGTGMKGTR